MGLVPFVSSSDAAACQTVKSPVDSGISERNDKFTASLTASHDQGNTSFTVDRVADGFNAGNMGILESSSAAFDQCQVIQNFVDGSMERTSKVGRARGSRKEKKRTEFINNAFCELRKRIPNVPMDTKLSKIKTLRLATSYIAYLTDIVQNADPSDGRDGRDFRADLNALRTRERRRQLHQAQVRHISYHQNGDLSPAIVNANKPGESKKVKKKNKVRTGWPETVWAMELENIPTRSGFQSLAQEAALNDEEFPNPYKRICDGVTNSFYSMHRFNGNEEQRSRLEHPMYNDASEHVGIPPYNLKYEAPMTSKPPFRAIVAYTGQDDIMSYFPYPPLPLPAASTFSKVLPPIPSFAPEIHRIPNAHEQTVNGGEVSAHGGANMMSTYTTIITMPQIQNQQSTEVEGSTLRNVPLIPEVPEEWRRADMPRYIFDKDAGLTPPSFVELKTVSAASIRISTSTINGFATFTTAGRPEMHCFGATRVAESSAVS